MPRWDRSRRGVVMSAGYSVVCECGRSNTLTPDQMGGRHPCYCGFMLVMPTLDEFRRNPVQRAYPSVLRKVHAHIAEGLLPGTHDCQECGQPCERGVEVRVVCEQSKAETTGGPLWAVLFFLFTLLLSPVFMFVVLFRGDPSVTTHHGRDTTARVPVCLCEPCQRRLTSRWNSAALVVMLVGAVLSAVVGMFAGWWAVAPAVVTLLAVGWAIQRADARRKQAGKVMLARVPGYAELLKAYRFAEVQVPRVGK